MKRILIEDLGEIACHMYDSIVDDGLNDVTFVGYYEDTICLVKELLMFDDVEIHQIEVEPVERDGYDMEYYVTLDSELNVWCEKAYSFNHDRYLYNETRRLFIADDCNSAILKEIDCDKNDMYEVSYYLDDEDPDCDGNCVCCNSEDNHEVVTRVAVDDTGKLRGFEKSWSTKEGNMTYHSTYTHYSNNTELLKQLMEDFDIKF